eukprot:TRINITY_DN7993_c0_g1_i1.p1 TRINITY_DN7993_c0_g1~~TRINITY_DN7993_c0_g1_i1.p1  ORF type:complete len:1121 (+),score=299.23 TRINITY_DN7993_c0_g1_i1:40-3402(+)
MNPSTPSFDASQFVPSQNHEIDWSNYGSEPPTDSYDPTQGFELEEGDWFEHKNILPKDNHTQPTISAIHMDRFEDLTWLGFQGGRLSSHLQSNMEKWCSSVVHASEIRQISSIREGILTLSANEFKLTKRGGKNLFSCRTGTMIDVSSFSFFATNPGSVILGGMTYLHLYDLNNARMLKEIPSREPSIRVDAAGRWIASAGSLGNITLRDPLTFNITHTFETGLSGITDMALKDDILVVSGWSGGRSEGIYLDPTVQVFDVRTFQSLDGIPFSQGAVATKFHPNFDATVVLVSQTGEFQFWDLKSPADFEEKIFSVGLEAMVDFDISLSGDIMSFADLSGYVTQWTNKDDPKINPENLGEISIMDVAPPPPKIEMEDDSPLSLIYLPSHLYNSDLLSNWNLNWNYPVPIPSKSIDTSMFPDFKQVDFVGYASNPGLRRNQTTRDRSGSVGSRRSNRQPIRMLDLLLQKTKKQRPPRPYRHVEITHTKFDLFDFQMYNKTRFGGLENTLPNSYCNGCLQTLYFMPELRNYMLSHLCKKEFCLSCELGFLFHMLDEAKGNNCEASNFLRSFRQIPQASGLGLTETPADDQVSLVRLMENFNRFILEQLHKEGDTPIQQLLMLNDDAREYGVGSKDIVDVMFGAWVQSESKCMSCKHSTTRSSQSFQFDMVYPDNADSLPSFEQVLKTSLSKSSHTKAWCEKCGRYQLTEQKRSLTSLPNTLCINTAASKADMDFWKSKLVANNDEVNAVTSWLPLYLKISLSENGLNLEALHSHPEPPFEDNSVYELSAVISHVFDPSKKASRHSHVVAQIKVPDPYVKTAGMEDDRQDKWYLFNDFHVVPITVQDVVDFSFKSPCVVYYRKMSLRNNLPAVLPKINPITEEAFFLDNPIKLRPNNYQPLSFIPLSRQNLPKPGDVVAIDAEFVSLGAEETELRSDGSRVIINPCHFSLARVSVIRGMGHTAGQPFIDDYIVTSEPVVDYLTKFSGIQPGDLDPKISKHHVTTLKSVYLKLRYLIDLGCIFLGHGLAKDFRIMNVLVPPEQIIDTVEIYHLEGQRKISLKFLASCLLNLDIQGETHDSIEDARTALQLYNKYVDLIQETKFDEVLTKIYDLGRQTKWTLPGN